MQWSHAELCRDAHALGSAFSDTFRFPAARIPTLIDRRRKRITNGMAIHVFISSFVPGRWAQNIAGEHRQVPDMQSSVTAGRSLPSPAAVIT